MNVVATFSVENRLESFRLESNSINGPRYRGILNDLNRIGKDYVRFGDNASYSLSKESSRGSLALSSS